MGFRCDICIEWLRPLKTLINLQRSPAYCEGHDDDDDRPRGPLLVLLPLAPPVAVVLVPGGAGAVRGGRAAPQPQQHVHVQPEDGEERDGERRGEEEALRVRSKIESITIVYHSTTENDPLILIP